MKRLTRTLAIILSVVVFAACSDNVTSSNNSDTFRSSADSDILLQSVTPSNGESDNSGLASAGSIDYNYDPDTRTLYLTHVDALFSSVPGTIAVKLDREENILTIVEDEFAGAGSLQRYDLKMKITDIPAGVYRVLVVEPNESSDQLPLTFKLDLVASLKGSFDRPQSVIDITSLSR
ncbi:hypothetical protein KQI65_09965 [bacterium]|nr:hypothetical protein [bacterium]